MTPNFSKLKGRIVECGLNQGKLAKALGISHTSFSLKINGKRDFTLTELMTMAKVLNMNSEDVGLYFFDGILKNS